MRTRRHDYIDPKTQWVKYGIQIYHEGRWKSAAENGEPCVFDDPIDRDKKMKDFRKIKLTVNEQN